MKLFLKILFFIFTIITAVVGESKSSTAVNLLQKEIPDSIYQKHQYTTFVFENHSINFCVNEESVVNYSEQGVTVAVNVTKTGTKLTGSQLKSISSLESQIAKHEAKLAEYIKDPMKFDNQGFLKNAPNDVVRQQIIQSRINHLQHEIQTFRNNIQKILNSQ